MVSSALSGRRTPVLTIYGHDGRERAEWEAGLSRHVASRVLQLPFGHWLHEDAPARINGLLDDWLGGLLSGSV